MARRMVFIGFSFRTGFHFRLLPGRGAAQAVAKTYAAVRGGGVGGASVRVLEDSSAGMARGPVEESGRGRVSEAEASATGSFAQGAEGGQPQSEGWAACGQEAQQQASAAGGGANRKLSPARNIAASTRIAAKSFMLPTSPVSLSLQRKSGKGRISLSAK